MRKAATRKSGQSAVNSSATDLFRSGRKASSKEMDRIDNLFYSYANPSSGLIEPEGVEALCSDLEVDHTNVRILMLAWKMKAAKQGYFTLEEWQGGLKALKADTVNKLKKALPELEKEVDSFVEYLKTQNDYKVINMDQWMGFFRFCNEISFPDLNNYDLELAWPLILDNFFEWMREKQK